MSKRPDEPGLLDQLARSMGTDVLADLRDPLLRKPLLRLIGQIPPERYSAAEWRDALCYLLLQPYAKDDLYPPLDNREGR